MPRTEYREVELRAAIGCYLDLIVFRRAMDGHHCAAPAECEAEDEGCELTHCSFSFVLEQHLVSHEQFH